MPNKDEESEASAAAAAGKGEISAGLARGTLPASLGNRLSVSGEIADILAGRQSTLEPVDARMGDDDGRREATDSQVTQRLRHKGDEHAHLVRSVADLGTYVRAARLNLGLNQQRFADLAGVGRRFVSELESGKPTLEADRVLRCCLAAGIDVLARPRAGL